VRPIAHFILAVVLMATSASEASTIDLAPLSCTMAGECETSGGPGVQYGLSRSFDVQLPAFNSALGQLISVTIWLGGSAAAGFYSPVNVGAGAIIELHLVSESNALLATFGRPLGDAGCHPSGLPDNSFRCGDGNIFSNTRIITGDGLSELFGPLTLDYTFSFFDFPEGSYGADGRTNFGARFIYHYAPIPEPLALLLLTSGLVGLAVTQRRRA
jgi:hypothetical protein